MKEQDLHACFELTDWSVFEAAATDLDELTNIVTSYISFCEDMCVPTRTYLTFDNNKPWFSKKTQTAGKNSNSKKLSSGKLKKNSFQVTSLHLCGKAWKPSTATRPHPPALRPINNWLKTWTSYTASLKSKSLVGHPTPTLTVSQHSHQHTVSQPVLKICEDDVIKVFRRQKIRRPRWCLSSLPQSLCCPAIIHLHTLHHHPCTQATKNHRT